MKKFKTVLSLFDGISGTQVALKRNGITYDNYYASEIDKYPITITQKNYPNTIQLGSVTDWREWDIDWSSVDLVCGGFPCQSWSVAGLGLGDKDVRGMLFWTMLDVIKLVLEKNPNAKFLMENVRMKKEFEDYITFHTEQALGKVNKHLINSALVSAQNRKRFYWTNIDGIEQPQDLGLVLSDILMDGHVDRDKSYCIDASYYKGGNPKSYFGKSRRQLVFNRPCELKDFDSEAECHHVATATDINGHDSLKRVYAATGKSPTLNTMTGGNREPKVLIVPEATKKGYTEIQDGDCFDATFPTSKTRRGRNMKYKSNCLTATNYEYMRYEHPTYRKLTPCECEALQTFPIGYTEGVSNSQRYRSLGNSFTVDVVAHIFKYL
tara:strand:- start:9 stop:1148 length:1140 start_codon:yes stop_codon:yes gene_type:complete